MNIFIKGNTFIMAMPFRRSVGKGPGKHSKIHFG